MSRIATLLIDEDGRAALAPVEGDGGPVRVRRPADGSAAVMVDVAALDQRCRRLIIGCEVEVRRVTSLLTASVRDGHDDPVAVCRTSVQPHVRAIGVLEMRREKVSWIINQLSTGYAQGMDALLADYGVGAASGSADGPALDDDAPKARSGQLIGDRYELQSILGSGAMGDVWLAFDHTLGRRVAVKHFRGRNASAPRSHQRMVREARLAARIDHRHAVIVHDLVIAGSVPYLVMQFVEGRTLDHRIDDRVLTVDEAAEIGRQVASALVEAHQHDIVHRDIKPGNILLDGRLEAKLGDFGIARAVGDASLTQSGYLIGTPAFLAPEVARGETADRRSDVYSLGATLWNAVEGVPPFMLDRPNSLAVLARILTEPFPVPMRGGALTPLIGAMTDPDPDRRPSAAEVEAALSPASDATPPIGWRVNQGRALPPPTSPAVSHAPPTEVGLTAPTPVDGS